MTGKPAKKVTQKKTAAKKSATATKKKTAAKSNSGITASDALAQAARLFEELMKSGDPLIQQDIGALLTSLQSPSAIDTLSDSEADARIQAQELAFDAMEAPSEAEPRKLAKRALRLDPDCVDAQLLLAQIDAPSPRVLIERVQAAVAAGERSLGDQFIRENTGHFWGLLDTRPYMRALEVLAGELAREGILLEAIALYEKMLMLNPNDNQGVRDPLLGLYLQAGNPASAGALLKRYAGDSSANFAWGRVLERYLSGDLDGAVLALKVAQLTNSFVTLYLTGQRPIAHIDPEMYSPGSEEEAVLCMQWAGLAWSTKKEAIFWLLDQCHAQPPSRIPSKAALKKTPVRGSRVQ